MNNSSSLSDEEKIKMNIHILKNKLSAAKSKLDNKKDIELIIQSLDPFKTIKYQIARKIKEKYISNAWLKCFSILMNFNILKKKSIIRHYDNASLPGAFILATKYIINNYEKECDYKWRACSLYNSQILHLGDSYGLIKQFPNNWLMDDKNDGDITNITNINDITKKLLNKTNLYTSDAGFDVSNDYNNQEILHFGVNTGQILLCLKVLQSEGICIIKHFTYLEEYTLKYLNKFSKLFRHFYFYKPVASKSLNSEIYLIGIGFLGCNSKLSQRLAIDLEYCLVNDSYSLQYEYPVKFTEIIYSKIKLHIDDQIWWLNKVVKIASDLHADNSTDYKKKVLSKIIAKYKKNPLIIYSLDRLFKIALI